MLSPLGKTPRRTAEQRRTNRRSWPMVAFIVIFVIAAVVVWWRVIDNQSKHDRAAACASANPSTSALTAHDVQVRVYNATDHAGLAATVSRGLTSRGLAVVATANDPTNRKVTGVAEIRYGSLGTRQAKLLEAALPGATMVQDKRTDSTVDVALGPHFRALATPKVIESAISQMTAATTPTKHC